MSFVMTETDAGTKQKCKDATERTPKKALEEFKREVDAWWNAVLQDAITLCPKLTGALSRTIKIIGSGTPVGGISTGFVAGAEGHPILDKMIIAGGDIDQVTGKFVTYAQAVHDGHMSRGGRWVQGEMFLENAVFIHESELDALIQKMLRRMEEDWSRD